MPVPDGGRRADGLRKEGYDLFGDSDVRRDVPLVVVVRLGDDGTKHPQKTCVDNIQKGAGHGVSQKDLLTGFV